MNKDFKKVILNNGISLYVHGDKSMRKYLVSYAVNYGSSGQYYKFNYDGKDYEVLPGCAHFLEHMLLEHSKYGNLYKYFQTLNYYSNAFTSDISTKYIFTGTKNIKSSIRKLIDALENPIFGPDEIKETSHAVAEETKIGLNDAYRCALHLEFRNLYKNIDIFHDSLCSIGTEETTNALNYDMLKLCYDAFYSNDRKMITITGPFDEDDMIDYIKKLYSKIPKHSNKTKLYIPDNLNEIKKEKEVYIRNTVEDDYLFIGYNNVIDGFTRFEKSEFIYYIYLSKFSSYTDFYERLIKDGVLVTSYGYNTENPFDSDNFSYSFSFIVKDKDRLLKEFERELENSKFDKNDFELFKKGILSQHMYSLENKYYDYFYLSDQVFRFGDESYNDRVKNLSFDRFIEFYNKLDYNNRVITLLTKEG